MPQTRVRAVATSLTEVAPVLGMALLAIGNWLLPGYILTGDLVFGPATPEQLFQRVFHGSGSNLQAAGPAPTVHVVLVGMEYLAAHGLPLPIIEKLFFLAILVLSGIGMYRLVPTSSRYPRYLSAFFFMVNPYTYDRFLAGHNYILLGYALLPLASLASLRAMRRPTVGTAILAGFWLSLVAISDHMLPMALALFLLLLVYFLWKEENRSARLKTFAAAMAFFAAVNFPWILATLRGESNVAQQVVEIGGRDLAIFKSSGPHVLLDLATLHGFWRDDFYHAKDYLPIWPILFGALIVLIITGVVRGWRGRDRALSFVLLAVGLAGFYLAAGTAHWISSPVFTFLYDNVTLFKGYREPQKFLALLALAYAFFAGLGADWIILRARGACRHLLALALFALLLASSYPMIMGLGSQVKPVDYPNGYLEARRLVETGRIGTTVLVLPWHQYMSLSWIDRPVANLGEALFDPPLVLGDNIEARGVYTLSTSPISRYVEAVLAEGDSTRQMGAHLAVLRVGYVVLLKEMDYERYGFLDQQIDLDMVLDDPVVAVFRNLAYTHDGIPAPPSETGLTQALAAWDHRAPSWPWYGIPMLFLLGGLAFVIAPRRCQRRGNSDSGIPASKSP